MKKYKKAQQLVEFALVSPIIIIFFIFLAEIGFVINTRIALAEAVKDSLTKANQLVGSSETDIKAALENSIKTYMASHNFPDANTATVEIFTPTATDGKETALIGVSYKYHPFFNFLSFLGNNIIPSEFNISSFQVVNSALLKENDYSTAFSSADLDAFSKNSSILKDQTIDGTDFKNNVAFLVGFDTSSGTTNYNYARLFSWSGQDLLPPNLAFNIQTGHLEVKSPYYNSGDWFDTKVPYTWVLTSLGFTHAIYSRMDSNIEFANFKFDLSGKTATGDISGVDSINKRAFNLYLDNSLSTSFGSFDLISSSGTAKDDIKNYTFNYNDNYILKLFIPANTRPEDSFNGYRYLFGLTSEGFYDDSGSSVNIVDCYIDSDGDGIPDTWDGAPEYPDADGNGVFDGEQTTTPIFTNIFPDTAVITSEIGTRYIAPPFKMDGVTLNIGTNNYAPAVIAVKYGKSGSALYFQQSGSTYTRKMPVLASLDEIKNFIDGTSNGSTINLNKSTELSSLDSNVFSISNKVIH